MAALSAALAPDRIRPLGAHLTGPSLEDCVRPFAPLAAADAQVTP
jgi:hypothetical protein